MKWLVTGSNGFVGTNLRKAVEARGDEFIGVPRSIYQDGQQLQRFIHSVQPDYIVHLATFGNLYYQREEPISKVFDANIAGLYNLLEGSKDIPYQALINISSSSVNQPNQTYYSLTKGFCEELAKIYAHEHGKPILTLRPYTLYGEHDSPFHLIPTVFRSCLEGEEMLLAPEPVHDYVYVGDFVDCIVENAERPTYLQGQVETVGTGVSYTNQQVVTLIEKITGKKAKVRKQKTLREYDTTDWVYDKTDDTMIQLAEGLQRYHTWYTEEVTKV